jgi:hypothetical protein
MEARRSAQVRLLKIKNHTVCILNANRAPCRMNKHENSKTASRTRQHRIVNRHRVKMVKDVPKGLSKPPFSARHQTPHWKQQRRYRLGLSWKCELRPDEVANAVGGSAAPGKPSLGSAAQQDWSDAAMAGHSTVADRSSKDDGDTHRGSDDRNL